MKIKELEKEFVKLYGEGEVRKFHSPGRINLIGEHIDYNGGYVFPCALDFGTFGCVRQRKDNKINLATTDFELKVSADVNSIEFKEEDDWANYPKGVIKIIKDKGYNVGGMDILISGNIPNGAGLSSSASLELLTGVIVNELFNEGKIDRVELVKIGQQAENEFVGVNCGIMDQFAIGMGKEEKAILLNCGTLEYSYADVKLDDYCLVIMNTNKRRALNESKYNERRSECDEAIEKINSVRKIKELCELTPEEFDKVKGVLDKENVRKRVEHAVYENERVKQAYECLNKGQLEKFGQLLTGSHNSLRDLYEVTGKELDAIVAAALNAEGCIGARMTGAGFGGCAIALVKKASVETFEKQVAKEYTKVTGYEPSFYMSGIGEGTCEI
ncbi:galactokinase [Clostridium oryzae]|uniref:Galactokinase n=1 Tax=Clostridium oryzae TaxID=1450648 RepID=A0A1V4ITK2_9CLOT|nr:galactokinase [Clostridium oryzae]OPJ63361.1 galactokinase [Clostridium oryzae]